MNLELYDFALVFMRITSALDINRKMLAPGMDRTALEAKISPAMVIDHPVNINLSIDEIPLDKQVKLDITQNFENHTIAFTLPYNYVAYDGA